MEEITSTFPVINNRYKILNTISTGGMAVIYRAKDIILDRLVALKILKKELSQKADLREQFSKEAKATARLSHINIVTTHDFGIYGDRLYIAMELIDGSILKDVIADNAITLAQRIDYLRQACEGLAYAHRNNIVHCDIKPQNMLISESGELKLTDFGISQVMDTLTRENTDEIWGSPYYIAPEIARGAAPSPTADIYSMGVVMYEVLTKKLPFLGDDVLTLVEKHQEEKPIPPKKINKEIPESINAIILKALSKDPDQRYPDASALLSEIMKAEEKTGKELPDSEITENTVRKKTQIEGDVQMIEINKKPMDWKTILLGFAAIIMVGGLIPFWLFIYYSINR
jgi:eukaryotic-like serine/threonine-protein kinase